MREIDITRFVATECMRDYSASVAEIGATAGADTWRAACDDAPDYADMLPDDDAREDFRAYVRTFGAWDDEHIAAWSNAELLALLLQMIAGDLREAGIDRGPIDWAEYERDAEAGRISGRICPPCADGRIFYCIGE